MTSDDVLRIILQLFSLVFKRAYLITAAESNLWFLSNFDCFFLIFLK